MSLESRDRGDTWRDADYAGRQSYRNGNKPSVCPYLPGDPLRITWIEAWYGEQRREQQRKAGLKTGGK